MVENVHELRPRPSETEKITINLGYVDLGHVDLMVQEGFYSNRTDFIRTAIRNQLERHADVVKQSTARKSLDLGLRNYSREDLEAARRAGEMLHVNVLGLASIAHDVTPELARATIASVSVLGALHASPAVKAALADRTREAAEKLGAKKIAIVGGVAANSALRASLPDAAAAPLELCTDNAAMIASAARFVEPATDPLRLDAYAVA